MGASRNSPPIPGIRILRASSPPRCCFADKLPAARRKRGLKLLMKHVRKEVYSMTSDASRQPSVNNNWSLASGGSALADELVDLDDGHEHGQHDAKHHHAHGEDQEWLEQGGEHHGAALDLTGEDAGRA